MSSVHRGVRRWGLALGIVFLGLVGSTLATIWARHGSLGYWKHALTPKAAPRFAWRSVDARHWQIDIEASRGEPSAVTDAREQTGAGCPAGMVRVKGRFREGPPEGAAGSVERLQDAACTDWISRDFPARCRAFDPAKLGALLASVPTRPMDFCVDRFEYPNAMGAYPMIVVTFHEAERLCKKGGKRLCSESEWTFACEGEESRPYPYGFVRDPAACVLDRPWRPFSEGGLSPRDGAKARDEVDRLWQGEPSGSRGACRSSFGVYDTTGNVDEWTRSVRPKGYASVLKGGYWGPVRARCRPATRAHNEDFVAYQQSFRCCAEAAGGTPAPLGLVTAAVASAAPAEAAVVTAAPEPKRDVVAVGVPSEAEAADDDELEALRKARVAVSCGARSQSPRGSVRALFFLVAAGVGARRRLNRPARGRLAEDPSGALSAFGRRGETRSGSR